MKLTGTLFELLGVGKGGVIPERGDAHVTIPSLLQPVFELSGPYSDANLAARAGASLIKESLLLNAAFTFAGALAAANADTLKLKAGLWHLYFQLAFEHDAPAAANSATAFQFVDPDGNTTNFFLGNPNAGSTLATLSWDIFLHTIRDGFFFRISRPATNAGEVYLASLACWASKLQ